MKKLTMTIVLSLFTLALGTSAYAVTNTIIGKKVDGIVSLYLDGNEFENQAIIIDGVSYVPVREAGEKLNLKVNFENGEIKMTSEEIIVETESEESNNNIQDDPERKAYWQSRIESTNGIIRNLEKEISDIEERIRNAEQALENAPDQDARDSLNNIISENNSFLKVNRDALKIYQNNLQEYITELEKLN